MQRRERYPRRPGERRISIISDPATECQGEKFSLVSFSKSEFISRVMELAFSPSFFAAQKQFSSFSNVQMAFSSTPQRTMSFIKCFYDRWDPSRALEEALASGAGIKDDHQFITSHMSCDRPTDLPNFLPTYLPQVAMWLRLDSTTNLLNNS